MNPKAIIYIPLSVLLIACSRGAAKSDNGISLPSEESDTALNAHGYRLPDPTRPYAHDPVIATQGDTIYAFSTGYGIQQLHTIDLNSWEADGPCIEELPEWVKEHNPEATMHLWAPDIIYANGLWHLYYCSSQFGKNTSVIGHMTNRTLNRNSKYYKWEDRGLVIESIPHRDFWNAIDPNVTLCADGSAWMAFGSFWGGIKLFRLDSSLSKPAEPQLWYTIASRQRSWDETDDKAGDAAIEAPFIFRHGEWFYLFTSFDYCCRGEKSTYHVVCGRSSNINGPYEDKNGVRLDMGGGSRVDIPEADSERYVAAGHCAVVTLRGHDYMALHGYPRNDSPAELMLRRIKWTDDDWPTLETAQDANCSPIGD